MKIIKRLLLYCILVTSSVTFANTTNEEKNGLSAFDFCNQMTSDNVTLTSKNLIKQGENYLCANDATARLIMKIVDFDTVKDASKSEYFKSLGYKVSDAELNYAEKNTLINVSQKAILTFSLAILLMSCISVLFIAMTKKDEKLTHFKFAVNTLVLFIISAVPTITLYITFIMISNFNGIMSYMTDRTIYESKVQSADDILNQLDSLDYKKFMFVSMLNANATTEFNLSQDTFMNRIEVNGIFNDIKNPTFAEANDYYNAVIGNEYTDINYDYDLFTTNYYKQESSFCLRFSDEHSKYDLNVKDNSIACEVEPKLSDISAMLPDQSLIKNLFSASSIVDSITLKGDVSDAVELNNTLAKKVFTKKEYENLVDATYKISQQSTVSNSDFRKLSVYQSIVNYLSNRLDSTLIRVKNNLITDEEQQVILTVEARRNTNKILGFSSFNIPNNDYERDYETGYDIYRKEILNKWYEIQKEINCSQLFSKDYLDKVKIDVELFNKNNELHKNTIFNNAYCTRLDKDNKAISLGLKDEADLEILKNERAIYENQLRIIYNIAQDVRVKTLEKAFDKNQVKLNKTIENLKMGFVGEFLNAGERLNQNRKNQLIEKSNTMFTNSYTYINYDSQVSHDFILQNSLIDDFKTNVIPKFKADSVFRNDISTKLTDDEIKTSAEDLNLVNSALRKFSESFKSKCYRYNDNGECEMNYLDRQILTISTTLDASINAIILDYAVSGASGMLDTVSDYTASTGIVGIIIKAVDIFFDVISFATNIYAKIAYIALSLVAISCVLFIVTILMFIKLVMYLIFSLKVRPLIILLFTVPKEIVLTLTSPIDEYKSITETINVIVSIFALILIFGSSVIIVQNGNMFNDLFAQIYSMLKTVSANTSNPLFEMFYNLFYYVIESSYILVLTPAICLMLLKYVNDSIMQAINVSSVDYSALNAQNAMIATKIQQTINQSEAKHVGNKEKTKEQVRNVKSKIFSNNDSKDLVSEKISDMKEKELDQK